MFFVTICQKTWYCHGTPSPSKHDAHHKTWYWHSITMVVHPQIT